MLSARKHDLTCRVRVAAAEGSKVPAVGSVPVCTTKDVVPEIIEGGEISISTM